MILIFLMGVIGVLSIWKIYYRRHWDKEVSVQLKFEQDFVCEGEQAVLREQIENRKRLPIPVLEVQFQLHKELVFLDMENTQVSDGTYKRDIFSLLGSQRITRRLALACTKMGYYELTQVTSASHSLFFAEKYLRTCDEQTELYVYAKRTEVSELLLICEKLAGAVQCEKRMYEDPFAFCGIREYNLTDPMKTINWKASAKTGALMVNTFASTQTERIMIYLNVEDCGIMKHERRVLDGISTAATLAQKLIGKGMEVGIAVNAAGPSGEGICMPPSGGGRQHTEIERMLAVYGRADKTLDYGTVLKNMPEDVMPIFISGDAERNQELIEDFLGSRQQGIWVLPFEAEESCRIQTKRNLKLYKRKAAGA